jgi:hypothetical protein
MKKYESFNHSEDTQFEFLATIGSVEKSIIHVVKIHEENYYKKKEISESPDFLTDIRNWIQLSINDKLITMDLMDIIKKYELRIYKSNKFKIFDTDESIFGILDDLFSLVNVSITHKDQSTINDVEEECQHILNNMDSSWIYQDGEDDWLEVDISEVITGLNEILNKNGKEESPWKGEEDLIIDLEKHIGKIWESFSYSDKLTSFNYIQKQSFLQGLTGKQREDLLDQFHSFFGL